MEASPNSNSVDNFDYPSVVKQAPIDSEGYVKAFSLLNLKEAKEFFSEYGFMVIENVLTAEQCEDSINDIWSYIEEEKWKPKLALAHRILRVKRSDITTWNSEDGWPLALSSEGILGDPAVFTKQAIKNRMNKALFEIGKLFFENDDIIVSHDRYGLFRPVLRDDKNVMKKWMTDFNIHLDMNPWNYYDHTRLGGQETSDYDSMRDFIQEFNSTGHCTDKNHIKLQALYNFIDNKEEDGGFQAVPGMQNHLENWTKYTETSLGKSFKNTSTDFIPIFWKSSYGLDSPPEKDKFKGIGKFTQRITARAGSIIVWSQFLPHGSAPNYSKNIRMAQFMKIGAVSQINLASRKRRAIYIQKKIDEEGLVIENEIEKKLMGLDVLS